MVAAHAYVSSWMETSASLANDDVSSNYTLSAELFDAEALGCAVASILTGSLSFFMGHILFPLKLLRVDRIDLYNGKLLAVSAAAMVAFPFLLFEDDYFSPALVFEYGCGHFGSIHEWRAEFEFLTFPKGEHFVNFDFRASVGLGITI